MQDISVINFDKIELPKMVSMNVTDLFNNWKSQFSYPHHDTPYKLY